MAPETPERIGKYEILSVLGQGGMGVVYKARDPLIDRIVAVKTIGSIDNDDDQLVQRLQMEARSAGRLHHPNIVTIFDFGREGETWYLAMEYVEGANLARIVQKRDALSLFTRIDIVIKLADALAYAHGLGVVHRDIKPSNICLTDRADPKILDFGLARFDETKLTRSGMTSGTIAYMSPERIRGESSPADDVFAVGAVAYELFTGQPAFPGRSYSDIATKILSGKYPAPAASVSDCPEEVAQIIEQTLAVRREDRLNSAHELAARLRTLRDSTEFQQRYSGARHAASGEISGLATDIRSANPYSAPELEQMAKSGESRPSDALPATEMMEARPATPATEIMDAYSAPPPTRVMEAQSSLPRTEVMERRPAERAPTDADMLPTTAVPAMAPSEPPMDPTVVVPRSARREHPQESPSEKTVVATVIARGKTLVRGNTEPLPGKTEQVPGAAAQRDVAFYLWAALTAAFTFAAFVSLPATSGVIFYAIAIASWLVLLRWSRGTRLVDILVAGGVARALTLLIPAPLPLSDATAAPLVDLFTLPFSGGMTEAMLWRVLLICADLGAVAMLWKAHAPRASIAYSMCPFLVVFGAGMAQPEALAGAALVGVLFSIEKHRDALAGLLAATAAGLSIAAVAVLPLVIFLTWNLWGILIVMLIVIGVPIMMNGTQSWLAPLGALIDGSPIMRASTDFIAAELADREAGEATSGWLTSMFGSDESGTAVSDTSLASVVLGTIVVAIATLFARRSRDAAAGMAMVLGVVLVIAAPDATAAWLPLAAVAVAGWRPGWLALALATPALTLVSPESQPLTFGVIIAAAAIVAFGARSRRKPSGAAAGTVATPAH